MYAVVRRYRFDKSYAEEINRKVNEGFLPIVSTIPGFVSYYWLETGEGEGTSLSIFQDSTGAAESVIRAADFVRRELPMIGKPEIIQGEVKAYRFAEHPPVKAKAA